MGQIISTTGFPLAIGAASGGKFYRYNAIDTTPLTVAPANTSRQKITFHNPGDVDIYIAPAKSFSAANSITPDAFTPSPSVLGGCWVVYANGGVLTFVGECQGEFVAFAASGSGKPLSITDSNT